jgi:PadR family transcriptional regulator PadR
MFNGNMKKGSAELLVLSLVAQRPRHGYEIGKLIEARSDGRLQFRIGSLYPILCRLEVRGLLAGRWVDRVGERRRRYYRLTPLGRRWLADQRGAWKAFVLTVNQVIQGRHV